MTREKDRKAANAIVGVAGFFSEALADSHAREKQHEELIQKLGGQLREQANTQKPSADWYESSAPWIVEGGEPADPTRFVLIKGRSVAEVATKFRSWAKAAFGNQEPPKGFRLDIEQADKGWIGRAMWRQ